MSPGRADASGAGPRSRFGGLKTPAGSQGNKSYLSLHKEHYPSFQAYTQLIINQKQQTSVCPAARQEITLASDARLNKSQQQISVRNRRTGNADRRRAIRN
ncbi:hypothetical protein GCM10010116_55600 [Microbispora rosea subsp. aerata]|nr:hypothetical protein GCM10010116_55600 [Microbispora rosea subsp. aerata]GLJ82869.1 hypothetical protein GCM10017588_15950 [Microbispora rosea subsp. aerata]